MSAAKVAITIDRTLLRLVDRWVAQGRFPNRSQAIQSAIRDKVESWKRTRLAEALKSVDPEEERSLAEERFAGDTWPES